MNCQISKLQLIGERLRYLHAHNALTLLRHSFSTPKLLHVLHTLPAFQTPLLISWDHLQLLRSQTSTSSQTVPDGFRPLFLCGLVVSAYEGPPILHPLPFRPQLIMMGPIY